MIGVDLARAGGQAGHVRDLGAGAGKKDLGFLLRGGERGAQVGVRPHLAQGFIEPPQRRAFEDVGVGSRPMRG